MHNCLNNLSAVLFDFDGTLAPNLDLPDMRRQVVEFTQSQGVPEAVYADRFIVEVITAAQDWLAQQTVSRTIADRYAAAAHQLIVDIELAAAQQTRAFAATVPLLQALRNWNKQSAIVTRNCHAAISLVLPELEALCDCVLARDKTPHMKPDPRHGEHALEQLNLNGSQCAMVGDGQMDMRFGRELGMFNIGVLSGSSDAEALRDAGADLILGDISELLD